MYLHIATLLIFFLINIQNGDCLWRKGIVYYAINNNDYDPHSQDVIITTLHNINKEICVKFIKTPMNYSANEDDKLLYISNPEKRRDCPKDVYDFEKTAVDMKIGYKCINEVEIAKMVVEMLRTSIPIQGHSAKSNEQKWAKNLPNGLLSANDRDYINSHYHDECLAAFDEPPIVRRAFKGFAATKDYYEKIIFPSATVYYGVDENLMYTDDMWAVETAMTAINTKSCVKFIKLYENKSCDIWFTHNGADIPAQGHIDDVKPQYLRLSSFASGARGHASHTLNLLMRILGVPMMSNRFDRNKYIEINWNNVEIGKEFYLKKEGVNKLIMDEEGHFIPYDFLSVTHASANYLCRNCKLGQQTVTPIQDYLWQKTLTMGRSTELSDGDVRTLNGLYSKRCKERDNRPSPPPTKNTKPTIPEIKIDPPTEEITEPSTKEITEPQSKEITDPQTKEITDAPNQEIKATEKHNSENYDGNTVAY